MRGIPEGGPASLGTTSDPPPQMAEGVTMPDNPYTRMLESITQGRGTVSLPPPKPVENLFEDLPDTVEEAIEPNVSNLTHLDIAREILKPLPTQAMGPLTGFQGLDLRTNEVWGDNSETFAMTPAEIEEAGQLCLRVAKRVMAGRLAELESRFAGKPKRGPRKK